MIDSRITVDERHPRRAMLCIVCERPSGRQYLCRACRVSWKRQGFSAPDRFERNVMRWVIARLRGTR